MKSNVSPVAGSIPFDPNEDSNGVTLSEPFTADNIQDAIIESRSASAGTFDVMLNDNFIILFNDRMERLII